ncbi:AAA family ATPase [Gautieria morchelliformis]|nr:AAA family ATPase [Gautieria morchelliformis]
MDTKLFKVELVDPSCSTSRAARRVVISAEILRASRVAAGDVVRVTAFQNEQSTPFAIGIAWPSLELSQTTIQVSSQLLLTARLSEGAEARVSPLPSGDKGNRPGTITLRDIEEVQTVQLCEDLPSQDTSSGQKRTDVKSEGTENRRQKWLSLFLRETLVDLKYLTPYQVVEVPYEGRLRRFKVIAATSSSAKVVSSLAQGITQLSLSASDTAGMQSVWAVGWDTVVTVEPSGQDQSEDATPPPSETNLAYDSIGGLDKQIAQIRDLIEIPLTRPDLFRHFGLKTPRGILLYGPPGTGKTHLARAVAASTHSSTLAISGPSLASAYHGETESKLRDVFREARERSPCVVIIDEVDALCPKRGDGVGGEVENRVVATLLTEMDGVGEHVSERVIVVATTNRPNAIDPALRRPGRFDREIEIGIPDATARRAILDVLLSRTPHSLTAAQLESLAARTHGYVGADLGAVVRDAGTLAIKRHLSSFPSGDVQTVLTLSDILSALTSIRPSALREVFVETPQVLWSDIGGQATVKQKLKECVEWPLLHPATFERLGVSPPKGVLLYGPPGCSKTLTAKALATESGINFIAIKGPELLNKFVGESERAVREIFRKARASSPSIIFFDEIDALAVSRAGSDGQNSHEGVLTSLLNEMDGIQELTGVTVVAATNRPDVLDSALTRPGRLDRILYVGPPDQPGREDILRIRTSKMAVDPDLDLSELAALTDGCSGAEIVAMCQDAALLTMQHDMEAVFVARSDFVAAAHNVRRQITPEMIHQFRAWRERSGLRSA